MQVQTVSQFGGVVSNPASYSGGPEFTPRSGHPLFWFPSLLSGKFRDRTSKFGHDHFLSHSLQLITH
jgi:hypothetical protein